LIVRKIYFREVYWIDTEEDKLKTVKQHGLPTRTDSVDLNESGVTLCIIIQKSWIFTRSWSAKLWNYSN
jgi:hypothetical protein